MPARGGRSQGFAQQELHSYLGIDLGSNGTRASMVVVRGGGTTGRNIPKAEPVENTNITDRLDNRVPVGEFSSTLLLYGEIGATIQGQTGGQVRLSAKSAFYSIGDLTRELKEKYRHLEAMKSRRGRRLVKKQLREALIGLLVKIKDRVIQKCRIKRIPLPTRVGLTVPADWDHNLLAAYQGIVLEMLDHLTPDNIVFCSETQALMHYAAIECGHLLFDEGDCRSTVLVADFGGHTAGVVIYDKNRKDSDAKPFLREIGSPRVVEGGSNVWEDHFRNWREDVRLESKSQLTKEDWAEIEQETNAFNAFKRHFNPSADAINTGPIEMPVGTRSILVDPKQIASFFRKAFEGPLKLVATAIRQLQSSPNPQFLVSGLITDNPYFRQIIGEMCQTGELGCEPIFSVDWEALYSGCAYVTADCTDIKSYLQDNNVTIGMQFVQPYTFKDTIAHTIYSKAMARTGEWYEFECDHHRVRRLVCCSTLPAPNPEGYTPAELNIEDCYDLTPGTLKINATGSLRIRIQDDDGDYVGDNEAWVKLELQKKQQNGEWKAVWRPYSFQLYYDAPFNNVLLFSRHMTEEAAMRRLRDGIRWA